MSNKGMNDVFDPKAFLAKVGTGRTNLKVPAGAVIYAQGDAADAIYFLQEGKVKVTVTNATGKEAVLAIQDAGGFFGEGCLNGQKQRMTTVTAITDSAIMRIDKAAMLATLRQEPKFSEMFIIHLLHRNSRVEEDLVDQLFNSSEKRLARTLLLLANFGGEGKPEPVLTKISQETLAEMIGTTRSRVSFFMNKFRRMGFIDYNGHIEVHSSLLKVLLNDGDTNDREVNFYAGGRVFKID